jgi:hypothetical protein
MLNFYNKDTIKKYNINYIDIYFSHDYGEACKYSDNAIWELCQYKDLIYVYLKKEYKYSGVIYYDLISPYGYSGYYYKDLQTFKDFIPLFRIEAKKKNYLTEVVKQSPFINIKLDLYYQEIVTKKLFSTEITNYKDYHSNVLKSKTRNIINKSNRDGLEYEIKDFAPEDIKQFVEMYKNSMDKVGAKKYYYFNKLYFEQMTKLCKIIKIFKNGKAIGQSLIILYKNFIHYHLSCSDYSSNLITTFLLDTIIRTYGPDKKIILGCGLKDNDSLFKFKSKISTNSYDYTIYKNIINEDVYNKINHGNDSKYFPKHRS